ncbi:hypothetical protein ACFV42_46500 [Streptomyces solisilvae]|uniref:hypothetical protein n=1 Tax=Streptomyces malaysiensis TaxID=92644 RepID=UPI003685E6E9
MTVFLVFTPARSTADKHVAPGPMEFFPSIEAAVREVTERGRTRAGHVAPVTAATSHTFREYQRVRQEVRFPDAAEGPGGWVALVWWRRSGEPVPRTGDQPGEVWLSPRDGNAVDRRRMNPGEWDTGRAAKGANARRAVSS